MPSKTRSPSVPVHFDTLRPRPTCTTAASAVNVAAVVMIIALAIRFEKVVGIAVSMMDVVSPACVHKWTNVGTIARV